MHDFCSQLFDYYLEERQALIGILTLVMLRYREDGSKNRLILYWLQNIFDDMYILLSRTAQNNYITSQQSFLIQVYASISNVITSILSFFGLEHESDSPTVIDDSSSSVQEQDRWLQSSSKISPFSTAEVSSRFAQQGLKRNLFLQAKAFLE